MAKVSSPPSGMASRALTTRLTRTCSSCTGSIWMWPASAARSVLIRMSSRTSHPKQILHVPDDPVRIDDSGLDVLAPGETQQAVGQSRSPLGRFGHIAQGPPCLGIGNAVPGQVHIPEYRCQEVVEIVSQPSRQPPNRFHALGLGQLDFEKLLLVGHSHGPLPFFLQHPHHHPQAQKHLDSRLPEPEKDLVGGGIDHRADPHEQVHREAVEANDTEYAQGRDHERAAQSALTAAASRGDCPQEESDAHHSGTQPRTKKQWAADRLRRRTRVIGNKGHLRYDERAARARTRTRAASGVPRPNSTAPITRNAI